MRTTPVLVTAWVGAAATAVGLGFFAVSLLDARPLAAASVGTDLTTGPAAAATSAARGPATGTATPTTVVPASTARTGEHSTEAGTVYGSCADGGLTVGSAPAAGWTVDDSSTPDRVEFHGGDRRLSVLVHCAADGPVFTVSDDDGDDGRGGGGAPTSSSGSPGSATSSSGAGSTAGSGGHGSDDPGGDDHGSGGHGSDDHGSDGSGSDGSGSDGSGDDGSGSGGHGSDD